MTTGDTLALIIPSKGRPADGHAAVTSAYRSGFGIGNNDVFVVVETDEEDRAYQQAGLDVFSIGIQEPSGRNGFVDPMNGAVKTYLAFPPNPKYIGFMGDDHRVRSEGPWWQMVLDRNEAFVYGDDLLQGVNLPTAVFIRTDVVEALGYFAPPVLQHLYADDAWLALGKAANSIHYEPRLVIEHMHPAAGKGEYDALKAELNDSPIRNRDREAFEAWRASDAFDADVRKIKSCVESS